MSRSVSRVSGDCAEEKFECGVDDDLNPTPAMGDGCASLAKDPATLRILKDGDWAYKIDFVEVVISKASAARTSSKR